MVAAAFARGVSRNRAAREDHQPPRGDETHPEALAPGAWNQGLESRRLIDGQLGVPEGLELARGFLVRRSGRVEVGGAGASALLLQPNKFIAGLRQLV